MQRTSLGVWVNAIVPDGTAAFVTGSFTPPANSLLVVAVAMMVNGSGFPSTGDLGQPTISGGGLTWSFVGHSRIDTSWASRQNVFTAIVGAAPGSMTLTVDDNNNQNIYSYAVSAIAFTDFKNSGPIQGLISSGTTNIGDGAHTLTLTAAPTANDKSLLFVCNDADNAPGNPLLAAGWTLIHDAAVLGGGGGLIVAERSGATSATVTITDVYRAGGVYHKGSMMALVVKASLDIVVPGGTASARGSYGIGQIFNEIVVQGVSAATARGFAMAGVITIEVVIPPLGEGDTPGLILWMLANSYYENLRSEGIEPGAEKPTGGNAATWGAKFFGS